MACAVFPFHHYQSKKDATSTRSDDIAAPEEQGKDWEKEKSKYIQDNTHTYTRAVLKITHTTHDTRYLPASDLRFRTRSYKSRLKIEKHSCRLCPPEKKNLYGFEFVPLFVSGW
jgi:hypothetical protein